MSECQTARVTPERAYSLLLERRLLLDDLDRLGLHQSVVELDDAAGSARAQLALDSASSAYLRGLSRPVAQIESVEAFLVPVPLRLYARARDIEPETTVEPGAVEQALRWERASVLEGRTMAEWAFLKLLAARAV